MTVTLATPELKQNSESNSNPILIDINNILKKKKIDINKKKKFIHFH